MSMTRKEAKMIAEELFKLFVQAGVNAKMLTPERYMTSAQAAEMLGISRNALYQQIDRIPHVKQGRKNIFKESALREYLENHGEYRK